MNVKKNIKHDEAGIIKLIEAARSIQDEYFRAEALRAIAPHLPEIWPEVLEAARSIEDASLRIESLRKIAAHLPEIWPEVLETACSI